MIPPKMSNRFIVKFSGYTDQEILDYLSLSVVSVDIPELYPNKQPLATDKYFISIDVADDNMSKMSKIIERLGPHKLNLSIELINRDENPLETFLATVLIDSWKLRSLNYTISEPITKTLRLSTNKIVHQIGGV